MDRFVVKEEPTVADDCLTDDEHDDCDDEESGAAAVGVAGGPGVRRDRFPGLA